MHAVASVLREDLPTLVHNSTVDVFLLLISFLEHVYGIPRTQVILNLGRTLNSKS